MTTRLEIPIPQPQQQVAFEFVDREDGLVEFHAETTEDHIAAFRKVGTGIDTGFWAQAAVVASLSKKHGHKGPEIEKLAEAVERSPSHLRHMALTYRTFTSTPECRWEPGLTFKHHMVACAYKRPTDALKFALEGNTPCAVLQEWVSEQNRRDAKKKTKRATQAVKTAFLEHLEHVEDVIENDFIANCPSKDFAQRVYIKGWLSEIKFELRQFNRKMNEDIVRAAIDDEGACTCSDIKEVTGLPLSDIEAVLGSLVAQNEYEWVKQGKTTDEARGSSRTVLHKVGTPFGTVSMPVAQSRYSN